MPKIEKPNFLTIYVQWTLFPFSTPHTPEQKSANSKWAVCETSKILRLILDQFPDIKIIQKYNGKVQLNINIPEALYSNGKTLWESILTELQNSEGVEYITVDVNNDTSEQIAANLADTVNYPWHTGYQGIHKETIIYHK